MAGRSVENICRKMRLIAIPLDQSHFSTYLCFKAYLNVIIYKKGMQNKCEVTINNDFISNSDSSFYISSFFFKKLIYRCKISRRIQFFNLF